MDRRLTDLVACPSCHSDLVFSGASDGPRLVSGKFNCVGCSLSFPILDGIPEFLPPGINYDGAFREEMEDIDTQMAEWVARNLESTLRQVQLPPIQTLIDETRRVKGPVIDIASGPGGSCCLNIMQDGDTDRLLVMTDLGRPVMKAWQRKLREVGWANRCSLMIFDARMMPFKDGSIPLVTSLLGLESVVGDRPAWLETGRILCDGGRLFDTPKFFQEGGPTQTARKEQGEVTATRRDYEQMLAELGLTIDRAELLYSGRGK